MIKLSDFFRKYNLEKKWVAEQLGFSYSYLWVLETKGGNHNAMVKYAPMIEALVPNCKDKIYIPGPDEGVRRYNKKEKVKFSEKEKELINEKAYRVCYRTLKKIFSNKKFYRNAHDRIMKLVTDDKFYCEYIKRFKD